jgi:hypothetical protein
LELSPCTALRRLPDFSPFFKTISIYLPLRDMAFAWEASLFTNQIWWAHAQYISVNEEGKDRCALDFILDYLINHEFKHKKYFDLGSSTEQNGQFLNESLIFQKEGFGGRGVCYETFEYDL